MKAERETDAIACPPRLAPYGGLFRQSLLRLGRLPPEPPNASGFWPFRDPEIAGGAASLGRALRHAAASALAKP